jgi:transformation/transcription domain-associated protein
MDEVVTKLVPDDVLTKVSCLLNRLTPMLIPSFQYMLNVMGSPADLWMMRMQFALQIAATSFMTYVFCHLMNRSPARFHVSRSTDRIAMSELFPGVASQAPVFASNDAVSFRFTPNIQRFIGPIFIEGIFTYGIMAMIRPF